VDNFVCRPTEKPPRNKGKEPKAAVVPTVKRKRGKGLPKEESMKRLRGPLEKRTCEKCGRVFTSTLGLKYHAEKKVCQVVKGTSSKIGQNTAYHTLEEGEEYVTHFGIVRVLKDDRAVPVAAKLPKDVAKLAKAHRQAFNQHEAKMERYLIRRHAQLRRRRENINELYTNNKVTQRSVFRAYLDVDAELMKMDPPEDPLSPVDAFPDRIVECFWIADRRQYFDQNGNELEKFFHELESPMKLYLRRRLLKEQYQEDGTVYSCEECAQKFNNHPAWKYHTDNQPCHRKKRMTQSKRKESEAKIVKAVATLRQKDVILGVPNNRVWKKKKNCKPSYGLYPEVLIALGFKLVTEEISSRPPLPPLTLVKVTDSNPSDKPQTDQLTARKSVKTQTIASEDGEAAESPTATGNTKAAGDPLAQLNKNKVQGAMPKEDEDPRVVLRQLQREYKAIQGDIDRKQYGPMYPGVYKSLGFHFPVTFPRVEGKIVKVVKVKMAPPKKDQKRKRKLPPVLPLAPIVDPKALIDEVLSGRYPSMKPFEGAVHMAICSVCKEKEGDLLCCNFCKHVEHIECFRTKFSIKDPEPGEEFMCHKCMGIVISRRNRAEKRRLNLYAKENKEKEEEQEMGSCQDMRNQEYHLVAARGCETNELVELLRDSQIRLKQSVRQMEMNNMRRRMLFG
jgi:hypothetical protein